MCISFVVWTGLTYIKLIMNFKMVQQRIKSSIRFLQAPPLGLHRSYSQSQFVFEVFWCPWVITGKTRGQNLLYFFLCSWGSNSSQFWSGFSPIVVEVRVPRSSCSFDLEWNSHTGEHTIFGSISRHLILEMKLANCYQQFKDIHDLVIIFLGIVYTQSKMMSIKIVLYSK